MKKSRVLLIAILLVSLRSLAQLPDGVPGQGIHISGLVLNSNYNTATLKLWDHITTSYRDEVVPHREITVTVANGRFDIALDKIQMPSYFSVVFGTEDRNHYAIPVQLYLASPGDRIFMIIDADTFSNKIKQEVSMNFSGHGSGKYKCRYALDSAKEAFEAQLVNSFAARFNGDIVYRNFFFSKLELEMQLMDKFLMVQLAILDSYKKEIEPTAYQILRADIQESDKIDFFSIYYEAGFHHYVRGHRPLDSLSVEETKQKFIDFYKETLASRVADTIPPGYKQLSRYYAYFQVFRCRIETAVNQDSLKDTYYTILNSFSRPIRDELLAEYFTDYLDVLPNPDSLILDAISYVRDSYYRKQLITLYRNQSHGAPSYNNNFVLRDTLDHSVYLNKFAGKVVFIDFYFTGCGACLAYYNEVLKDVEHDYANNPDIVFLTISTDRNKKAWISGIRGGNYCLPQGINLYTGGHGFDHPIIQYFNVGSFPRPLLLDKTGRVFENNTDILRNKEKLVSSIEAALAIPDLKTR